MVLFIYLKSVNTIIRDLYFKYYAHYFVFLYLPNERANGPDNRRATSRINLGSELARVEI